jgi:hypothetical protein
MKDEAYSPLNEDEAQRRANNVARVHCVPCNGDYESKCKNCIWYKLMNEIVGVDTWEEEEKPQ